MKDQSSDKSTAMKHDLREKADAMAAAFHKLLTDLAKDGTAIEGFTAAWNAHLEYNHAVINYELARLSPVAPEPSLEKPDFTHCIKWLEEERNILQNTGSLMWHKPEEQRKTLAVAKALDITLQYIKESELRKKENN